MNILSKVKELHILGNFVCENEQGKVEVNNESNSASSLIVNFSNKTVLMDFIQSFYRNNNSSLSPQKILRVLRARKQPVKIVVGEKAVIEAGNGKSSVNYLFFTINFLKMKFGR